MLVIQSFREDNVPEWIAHCMHSVQQWVESVGAINSYVGDEELLGLLPDSFQNK